MIRHGIGTAPGTCFWYSRVMAEHRAALASMPADVLHIICAMSNPAEKSLVRLARTSKGLWEAVGESSAAWGDVDCSRVLTTADGTELKMKLHT